MRNLKENLSVEKVNLGTNQKGDQKLGHADQIDQIKIMLFQS